MYSRIVMDVDDVISTHRNRDYINAIPNMPVIEKMRELTKQGIDFVLFTARGQISCNGDIEKIEKEKGPILRTWLKKHEVPYSELCFGKPIGDIYVDDAAMTPEEFISSEFISYKGGSNEYIERLGKFVVKECKSVDSVAISDWFDAARLYGYNVPKVYARTYNKMRMEHIPGTPGNEIKFSSFDNIVLRIANTIISFAGIPGEYEFDFGKYEEYVMTNCVDSFSKEYVPIVMDKVFEYRKKIIPSFCHGDLTTMNTIINDGEIYLIDPIPHNSFSSYLMDIAKLRMSINGYNDIFYSDELINDNALYLQSLDRLLLALNIYDVVIALELSCWIRLIKYRYKEVERYELLKKRIRKLTEEIYESWWADAK